MYAHMQYSMACVLSHLSHVWLFATQLTVPARVLCPWGFSRQEYWNGLPCLPPGDLPNPGIEPRPPTLQADSLHLSHQGSQRILEWVAYPSPGELSDPGTEPRSPKLYRMRHKTDALETLQICMCWPFYILHLNEKNPSARDGYATSWGKRS